jgi:2-polyprenyl-6-methoxyphenol hydroxylase-like FAD-dependent oxidoreductase
MAKGYDVIVVGARCAGSPLATLLARAGLKVCLVDRDRFPSDTPSTHGIQPVGVKILEDLGVLGELLEVTAPIDRGIVTLDDLRTELAGVTELFGSPMLNVRRVTLDAILVDAAVAAGAELRTQTAVTGLVEEGGRVVGVRTREGELRAPLVVGADGARSSVARLAGAAEYDATPAGRMFMWCYFEGVEPDGRVWLGKIDDTSFLASQTDNGLFMAAAGVPVDRRDELRGNRERGLAEALAGWPELHATVGGAERVGPVQVMSRWHGFFRESAGRGWALVGDAGHFKDPTPGQGISDALRQVVALSAVIEKGLGGAGSLDELLREWWAWRDRDAWQMYWFAHDMGAAGRTPLLFQEIQHRIVSDERRSEGLMRVLNHDVEPSEVFTPGLVLAAMPRALLRHRGQRRTLLREARGLVSNELRRRRGPQGVTT